jgi:pimeloyl-ACP methyl ester carboxylesterase
MAIDPTSDLYFEAFGPANAPTIVFLHGGGVAGWMWRKQVEALKSEYHCLVPDMPEQGENATRDTQPFTTAGASERIAAFIHRQAPGGKAHVVGLSEGAQVTVELLSRAPEVIDHAMVSSAILRPMWALKMYTPGLVAWSFRWFVTPFKNNDWWIRLNMRSNGISDEYYTDFKRGFQTMTEASMVNLMFAGSNYRLPAGLEKVHLPVLVAVGNKEYKEMQQSGRDLLAALPNARGVIVSLGPKATLAQEHSWAMTAPGLFTTTLKAWIEDRPLPDGLEPLD